MKIVAISDTHGCHGFIPTNLLPEADMIIHAGDISGRGYVSEIQNFMYWFSHLDQYKYKILIAGNHDFLFERNPEHAKELIPDNIIYLNDSGIEIEGFKIWGSPITPFFYNWAFNRFRGSDIWKHWELIPSDTDILVTHGPPYSILDMTERGDITGCEDLRKKIFEIRPKVHIFGHIHEGYGEKSEENILFLNASILNTSYRYSNPPHVFEIDNLTKEIVY